MTGPRIDGARMLDCLRELARIGADPQGGLTRLGLTEAESQARAFIAELSRSAGLVTELDPAANLFVRRPGADPGKPVLLMGSHLDTVVQGGWLDGAFGVAAAVEVVRVLTECGQEFPCEPVAVAFANEEGALIQEPFWGSRALCGVLGEAAAAADDAGRPVSGYLADCGGDPGRLAEAAWAPGRIRAFLELHIEQGPVLERLGLPIGIVDGIVGRSILEAEISGEQQHAGTTPMPDRRDALAAAAELLLRIRQIAAADRICSTATVGHLEVSPNTTNTIPGLVRLRADVRDTDAGRLTRAEAAVRAAAASVGRVTGCQITVTAVHQSPPARTDPGLRQAIAAAAGELALAAHVMPSGAGHDAQVVAGIAPVGMIFVPSRDGVSHAPAEDTSDAALTRGAGVLLRTAIKIAASARPARQDQARHDQGELSAKDQVRP
ncbi:MAG TPA: Zn-dependent hydrolase [Streptosporangiaceae bacterium]|nr:Zn-dependent hydrolase [Streptosporangiaceae bacterium]